MNILRIFLVVISALSTTLVSAATITSTTTGGNWSAASTWIGGVLPAAGDDAVINGPVVIDGNYSIQRVTINSGKTLTSQNGGAYKLTLTYNNWGTVFTNNGTFNANDGTVEMKSSNKGLSHSGTTTFNNLILDNIQQMNLSGTTINGTLRLNNGAYISTHPTTYGSSSTLEINGSYNLNGNDYLWPTNAASSMPANIRFVSGTTVLEQVKIYVRKSFTVATGASVNGTNSCFYLQPTFTNFAISGTLSIGSIIVNNGATWNLNADYTINKLKIESSGVVNAGSHNLVINATTTNGCGISGMVEVVTGGVFNAGTGTVTLTPTNWYSVNGNITFNNLVVNDGGSGTVVIPTPNTVTVNGNVTVNSGGNVNQANNINYGTGASVTNNGTVTSNNNNFPPTVSTTPPSITYLTGSVSGSKAGAAAVQSSASATLTGDLNINSGSSKVLTISPASELTMGSYTITADTVYIYGKLNLSNANGLAGAFLRSSGSPVIVIGAGSTITYNGVTAQTVTARTDYVNLKLNGNGVKTFAAGNYNISGDFTVEGGNADITTNVTSFNFNGGSQTIKGLPYKTVTFSGSGDKTLSDTANVTGVVTISGSAKLLSNGLLTLVSNASGTASIGPITGSASISGNINYQRYVPAGRLWRFIGWPINGNTFANSWQNDIFITGAGTGGSLGTTNSNGFDFTASSEAGLYYYNETSTAAMNAKWTTVPSTTTAINSTRGYRLFVRGARSQGISLLNGSSYTPLPVTLKGTGTPNTGDITVPLTCSNGCGTGDGWHLISNPYPSAIEWNNASWVAARANVQATLYIYNPAQNRYGSWNPTGGSVNGGSSCIASGQSFYIKTNSATSITFKEIYKVSAATAGLFGKSGGLVNNLKMQIGDNSKVYDETVVYMYPSATMNVDQDLDATKPDAVNASISTYTAANNSKLVFNAIPEMNNGDSATIMIHMPLANATYTYNITFNGIETFANPSTQFFLNDRYTGSTIIMSTISPVYSFSTVAGTAASYASDRFILTIKTAAGSLPVKLTAFSGIKSKNTSVLKWTTASEVNNDRFEIQRSNDGISYITIGAVSGSPYSVKRIDYSFTDESPAAGVNYYRLKQVDHDGTATLSAVISINFSEIKKAAVSAWPIPATDYITVDLNNSTAVSATIRIVDMVGKTMLTEKILADETNYNYPIQIESFKPGVYFIEVSQNDGSTESVKFIKN